MRPPDQLAQDPGTADHQTPYTDFSSHKSLTMKVTNKVIIELTQDEAIQLAMVLPDSLEVENENQKLAATIKKEICDQLDMNSWDL